MMGFDKTINVKVSEHKVGVRDYGRGIPLGKVVDCVSKMNTDDKYGSCIPKVFRAKRTLESLS